MAQVFLIGSITADLKLRQSEKRFLIFGLGFQSGSNIRAEAVAKIIRSGRLALKRNGWQK